MRANPLLSLGALLNGAGRPEAAEPPLREALELGRNGLPGDHRLVFRTAVELGRCLVLLRRFEEAEPLLVEGFDKSRERDVDTARRAARHLVALYEARGMDQRGAPYRGFLSGQNS